MAEADSRSLELEIALMMFYVDHYFFFPLLIIAPVFRSNFHKISNEISLKQSFLFHKFSRSSRKSGMQ